LCGLQTQRRTKWDGYIVRMGEMLNTNKLLATREVDIKYFLVTGIKNSPNLYPVLNLTTPNRELRKGHESDRYVPAFNSPSGCHYGPKRQDLLAICPINGPYKRIHRIPLVTLLFYAFCFKVYKVHIVSYRILHAC
jgi:hypothetical protein